MYRKKLSSGGVEGGFSLVELLVVVAILAILAAITIPLFLNQKKKAEASALRQDLRVLISEVEVIKQSLDLNERFPNDGVYATGYPNYTQLKTYINESGFKKSNPAFSIGVEFNCKFTDNGRAVGDASTPFFGNGDADGYYVVRGRTKNSYAGDETVTQYMYNSATSEWEENNVFDNGGRWGWLSGQCRYHTQW